MHTEKVNTELFSRSVIQLRIFFRNFLASSSVKRPTSFCWWFCRYWGGCEDLGQCCGISKLLHIPVVNALYLHQLHTHRTYNFTAQAQASINSSGFIGQLFYCLWRQNKWDVQCCFTSTETIRAVRDEEPKTATSTFTQLLSSDKQGFSFQYCFTSTETIRLIRNEEPTSTFT